MATTTDIPTWTLGDRLRKARECAGMSAGDMADHLGVARNTISNYENDHTGRRGVPRMALLAYAERSGVPIEWIETGDADPVSRWITDRLDGGPPVRHAA